MGSCEIGAVAPYSKTWPPLRPYCSLAFWSAAALRRFHPSYHKYGNEIWLAIVSADIYNEGMLLENLKRHWWVPVLRGVAAIIFGVIAFTHPVMAAATLVLFFGAWVLIDGIFRVIGAIGHRASDKDWGFDLIIGLVGIIIGLLTFHAPQITALALIIYIAAWAFMIGATEIATGIKLRREIKGEWFLILMGLLSIAFAVLLLWNPLAGAAAIIWIMAWYAVLFGILGIFLGFRLRSLPLLRAP